MSPVLPLPRKRAMATSSPGILIDRHQPSRVGISENGRTPWPSADSVGKSQSRRSSPIRANPTADCRNERSAQAPPRPATDLRLRWRAPGNSVAPEEPAGDLKIDQGNDDAGDADPDRRPRPRVGVLLLTNSGPAANDSPAVVRNLNRRRHHAQRQVEPARSTDPDRVSHHRHGENDR